MPLFPTLRICIFRLLPFASFKGPRFIRRTISDSFAKISLSFSRRGIRGRNETEASNSRLFSRAQPNELSAFFTRALHSFLDCICPLLDIPFYWTEPRSFPSFLPTCILLLCRRPTIHAIRPSLPVGSYLSLAFLNFLPFPQHLSETPASLFWRRAFRPRHRFIPRLEFQTLLFILPRIPSRILDLSSSSISG